MYKMIITVMLSLSVFLHADTYADTNADTLFDQANQASLAGDYVKAYALMRESAQKGSVYAQVNTGLMYEHGQGTDKDMDKARYWYEKASQQGDVKARYNLGLIYEHGKGVEKDIPTAAYWYKMAADNGLASAQYALGVILVNGKQGVALNKIVAFEYWMKAARQSHLEAQKSLDRLCKESPWACK